MRALPNQDNMRPLLQQKGTDRLPSGARENLVAPLVAHSGKAVHEVRSIDHAASMEASSELHKRVNLPLRN